MVRDDEKVLIRRVRAAQDLQQCMAIRYTVFVEGQQVPMNEEVDGKDTESEHYLLSINDDPIGVARVRYVDDFAKIERVAVLANYQGKGLGHLIMSFILNDLRQSTTYKKVKLSSQTYAIPFYEKLGFVVCSEEYLDAGIPHKDMLLTIDKCITH